MAGLLVPPFRLSGTTSIVPRSTGITAIFGNTGGFSLSVGGTSAATAQLDTICATSTTIGHIVKAAASQSVDLSKWLDSSGNPLLQIQSDGTVIYLPTDTSNFLGSIFSSASTLTGTPAISFFNSQNVINFTSSPAFGFPPFFFFFRPTVKISTQNVGVLQPAVFVANATHIADGFIWTGGDTGAIASFVDQPIFSVANSGSYTTYTHNGYKSGMAVNTGATIATRRALVVNNATGAGTLTDQIGLDIATLTKGASNNIAIRTGASGVLEIGNKFTKYNNIATVSNGVPSELATVDLATQAAAIAATTIYTPTATGLFRISIYLQVTRAATTSSILGGATGVVITYNDGDGNVAQSDTAALATTTGTIAITAAGNTTATNLEGTMVIYARTGVAIQYAIGYTSVGVTTMQFAAHLKVEAL